MRYFLLISSVLFLAFTWSVESAQNETIELTKDNPQTLISTNSTNYSIYGLRLGIARAEAQKILDKLHFLMAVQDTTNPSRIYVYSKKSDGSKNKAVLYLIWEPGEIRLGRITVFQSFRDRLAGNFKRLLTFEVIDSSSPFKREFIGYANRSKVTLDIPNIDLKYTTYYYDEMGLEISYKHSLEGDEVVFALVERKL